jgi:hypothetical protein
MPDDADVTSERLAIGLLFVIIVTLACFAPAQSDTWWHLRSGQDIWQTGAVSLHDTYSSTAAGGFWPNHEWLTEVIFYTTYRIAGLPLVTGVCAAAIVVAWSLSWRLAHGPFEIRFLLFAAGLASATGDWAIRPQVFSMAAFALATTLLVARRPRWLPPLFVVWANMHGGVAFGVVAVAAALVAAIATEHRVPRSLGIAAVGCVVATTVSPLGFRLWPEILASIERSRMNDLVEWHMPGLAPVLWPFWAVAIALPVAVVLGRHRFDGRTATLAAIALAALPLAIRSVRNVPMFLLVGVPALSTLVARRAIPSRPRSATGEHRHVNAAILAGVATLAAGIVALAWYAPAPGLGWRPITANGAGAIAACEDPIYNTYQEGGVLLWFVPSRRVFIDNRQDPYPLEFLRDNHRLEFDGDYRALFARYGVRCAVVPPAAPITEGLRHDPAWSLRYSDDRWAVFDKVSTLTFKP